MKKKRYTLSESAMKELRECKYVRSVSTRMVQFTAVFKRHALKERESGVQPLAIFKNAGIPYHFSAEYAADRISAWRKIADKDGKGHFDSEHRGQAGTATLKKYHADQKAYKNMPLKEKVKYLEARNEALDYIARHFQLPPSIVPKHSSRRRKNMQ